MTTHPLAGIDRDPVDDPFLVGLPKIELHVHLEGSIRAETAARLARSHGEDPDRVLELVNGDYPRRFDDFTHFVRTFLATSGQLRDPQDLATVAADFARHQAEQSVVYTEATFTAVTHVDNGMEPTAMWQALREGFASVPETRIALIVDAVRNLGVGHAERTVELVADADAPIVGLGLAGIEDAAPARDSHRLRAAADELGLGLAIHAGETGAPDAIRSALDDLGADRIGHGVACVHDPALLRRLVHEQVPLEVCPSSNVSLQVVADLDAHPLARLLEAGANVTVNSDDPPFFTTTLTHELAHARRLAGLDDTALAALQRRAAAVAFAGPARRAELDTTVAAWQAQTSQPPS